MTESEMDNIYEGRVKDYFIKMRGKGPEHTTNDNVFSDFIDAGHIMGVVKEAALYAFLTKSLIAIRNIASSPESADLDMADKKIGDAIIYLLMLFGMLKERKDDAAQ